MTLTTAARTVSPPRPPVRTARPSIMQRAAAERTRTTIGRRRVVNVVMVGITCARGARRDAPARLHSRAPAQGRRVLDQLGLLHPDSQAARRSGRRHGERHGRNAGAHPGGIGVRPAIGIGAGLYLAENRGTHLANAVRFLSDVLNGLPSIVMGIFAWQFLVKPMGKFTALAGGIALGAMMIPLVTRTTEEMIRIVPVSLREAALALGYSRWRTSLVVVLRTALPGIVTGALVAVSRIAGETAPLLFTVLGNQFWSASLA